jgi:catechol 2,3-dioxygenase-like lactoylglutathione lyase family enzyme
MKFGPGINHLEIWVSNEARSVAFYKEIFSRIGWKQISPRAFATTSCEIYFYEKPDLLRHDSLGIRHLCLHATSARQVEEVAAWLREQAAEIIRGPVERDYSEGYYTVDFRDPDGFILEVAYTPNQQMG